MRDTCRSVQDRRFVWMAVMFAATCLAAGGPGGAALRAQATPPRIGLFEGHGDIGAVQHAGTVVHDVAAGTYRVSGGGENMWFAHDAFHFVWRRVDGDVAIAADVELLGAGKNPHRKAVLMIRQSLDADAAYVDIARHGDGLTSLQFRAEKGARTQEVQASVTAPTRLRLERRGSYARMYLGAGDGPVGYSGAAVRVAFDGPVYVGIGVCAHEKDVVESAVFSRVEMGSPAASTAKPTLYSTLETMAMASTDRRVVYVTPTHIEAPNWLRDGTTLVYNSGGRLYRLPAAGGAPSPIDTGAVTGLNNDHGVSPDGATLVISARSEPGNLSRIYTLPVSGGPPRLITPEAPSYWHGWSPDGRTLAYTARRNDEFDIYTIPVEGGTETRLTTAKGLDDGPEYTPDGRFIYFNTERRGRMEIWRMRPDGSGQEPVVADATHNWFPHPSPDGRTIVFLTYDAGVTGHPANKDVMLRRLTLASGQIDVLARLFGGQGTINVPPFSPDGTRIAFVSYQLIPE